jgi:hypothetical protein
MDKFFPKGKIMITGNPVRRAIVNSTISQEDALHFFGLETGKENNSCSRVEVLVQKVLMKLLPSMFT